MSTSAWLYICQAFILHPKHGLCHLNSSRCVTILLHDYIVHCVILAHTGKFRVIRKYKNAYIALIRLAIFLQSHLACIHNKEGKLSIYALLRSWYRDIYSTRMLKKICRVVALVTEMIVHHVCYICPLPSNALTELETANYTCRNCSARGLINGCNHHVFAFIIIRDKS